jgi:hypothetical protein
MVPYGFSGIFLIIFYHDTYHRLAEYGKLGKDTEEDIVFKVMVYRSYREDRSRMAAREREREVLVTMDGNKQ